MTALVSSCFSALVAAKACSTCALAFVVATTSAWAVSTRFKAVLAIVLAA